jgi:predicted 2-oxoglutarate/Fe(II)-dependent dioxygenase YbiX
MKTHHDHIQSLFDGERKGIPVLSIVGLLNDDFDGGEFVFFDEHKVNLKKGDILIFPSIFIFPHRVAKVTKGTRYSFVSWAW